MAQQEMRSAQVEVLIRCQYRAVEIPLGIRGRRPEMHDFTIDATYDRENHLCVLKRGLTTEIRKRLCLDFLIGNAIHDAT